MESFKAIDYDHTRDGALCNGIISDLEGRLEAIWTFDLYGRPVTRIEPFFEAAFAKLWNGIATSLSHQGVFWRHLVTDPCQRIDPVASHVIVASSAGSGRGQYFTFMVPANEADPDFTSWLAALGVPSSATPASPREAFIPRAVRGLL